MKKYLFFFILFLLLHLAAEEYFFIDPVHGYKGHVDVRYLGTTHELDAEYLAQWEKHNLFSEGFSVTPQVQPMTAEEQFLMWKAIIANMQKARVLKSNSAQMYILTNYCLAHIKICMCQICF